MESKRGEKIKKKENPGLVRHYAQRPGIEQHTNNRCRFDYFIGGNDAA